MSSLVMLIRCQTYHIASPINSLYVKLETCITSRLWNVVLHMQFVPCGYLNRSWWKHSYTTKTESVTGPRHYSSNEVNNESFSGFELYPTNRLPMNHTALLEMCFLKTKPSLFIILRLRGHYFPVVCLLKEQLLLSCVEFYSIFIRW